MRAPMMGGPRDGTWISVPDPPPPVYHVPIIRPMRVVVTPPDSPDFPAVEPSYDVVDYCRAAWWVRGWEIDEAGTPGIRLVYIEQRLYRWLLAQSRQ